MSVSTFEFGPSQGCAIIPDGNSTTPAPAVKTFQMGCDTNVVLPDSNLLLAEKISCVVLIVFALYVDIQTTLPFLILGLTSGIYKYANSKGAPVISRGGDACSLEFLEQITGIKLPPYPSLLTKTAVMICHIEHHTIVFGPLTGVLVGARAGESGARYGMKEYRKLETVYKELEAEFINFINQ